MPQRRFSRPPRAPSCPALAGSAGRTRSPGALSSAAAGPAPSPHLRTRLFGTLLSSDDGCFFLRGLFNSLTYILHWKVPEYSPSQQLFVLSHRGQETGMCLDT